MANFDKVPHFTVFVTFNSGKDGEREDIFLKSLERRDRRLLGSLITDLTDRLSDATFMTAKLDVAQRIQKNVRKILKENRFAGKVEIGHWDANCQNLKEVR